MNSINFKLSTEDAAPRSWETASATVVGVRAPDQSGDAFQSMSQMRAAAKFKTNPKQRVVGIVGALVLQTAMAVALIFGTEIKAVFRPETLTVVAILEETKPLIPVEPPPPPRLIAPQVNAVTLPPMPQITVPVPPAPPAPTAITTSNTLEPVTPPIAIVESYQVRLLRYLAGYRRYPRDARAKHQEGVVFVRFSMDRRGNVLSSQIEKRSRYVALDDEALTVFKRANPLPAPPPELAGDPLLLVMPVEFSLR